MLSYLRPPVKKSISEEIYDNLLGACIDIKDTVSDDLEDIIRHRAKEIIDNGKDTVKEYLKDPDNYKHLVRKIKRTVIKIEDQRKKVEQGEEVNMFDVLFKSSKKWLKYFSSFNGNKCNIVIFGKTQVGKTATIKNLFGVKELQLKGGIKSDTVEVKEYIQDVNNVQVTLVDTPGFFDSDGRDNANFEKIKTYMTNNNVHLILWLAKLSDMPNIKERELIEDLTTQFGSNVWQNLVVVLTHANETPPQEYFEEYDELHPDEPEYNELINPKLVSVWTDYVIKKRIMWQNIFAKHGGTTNINISLVENNNNSPYKRINKRGDKLLIDGTPIWENLMTHIFKSVSDMMKPYTFLALAGKQDDTPYTKKQQNIVTSAVLAVKTNSVVNSSKSIKEVSPTLKEEISQPIIVKKTETNSWFCTIL
jgi:GTPase SAR1 family protein